MLTSLEYLTLHSTDAAGWTAGAVQVPPTAGLTPLEQVPKQVCTITAGDRLHGMQLMGPHTRRFCVIKLYVQPYAVPCCIQTCPVAALLDPSSTHAVADSSCHGLN